MLQILLKQQNRTLPRHKENLLYVLVYFLKNKQVNDNHTKWQGIRGKTTPAYDIPLPTTQINLSDFQIQYRATSIHDLQFGNQIVYILYLPSPTSILMYFVNIEFFPLC